MMRTNCGLSTYYTPGVNRAKQNSHFFEGLISWMHLNLHDPNDFETPKYSFMHSIKKELSPWSFSADTSLVLKSNVVLALFSQVFQQCVHFGGWSVLSLPFSHLKSSCPADLCVPDSQCDLSTCQSTLFTFAANLGICIQWPNNKEWHWTAFTIPVLVKYFESHQWLCVSRVLNVLCIESTKLKLLLLHLLLLWSPLCVRPAVQMYSIFLIFEQLVQYLDSNLCCV